MTVAAVRKVAAAGDAVGAASAASMNALVVLGEGAGAGAAGDGAADDGAAGGGVRRSVLMRALRAACIESLEFRPDIESREVRADRARVGAEGGGRGADEGARADIGRSYTPALVNGAMSKSST